MGHGGQQQHEEAEHEEARGGGEQQEEREEEGEACQKIFLINLPKRGQSLREISKEKFEKNGSEMETERVGTMEGWTTKM